MLFLDPKKPIAGCESRSCDDCHVVKDLHCHFTLKDWAHFLLISFPPFLLGGAGIYHMSVWLFLPWVLFLVAFFGFIEIRVMCSHCPHYGERETYLKCWANYGAPKPWKYRPGPMTVMEKAVFFFGFAVVWGYPIPFLTFGKQLFLLTLYLITTAGFFMTLKMFMCSKCMNFACPLNSTDKGVREKFFKKNPSVAKAWEKR